MKMGICTEYQKGRVAAKVGNLEEMEREKGKVCVTGGAGYLASNLIKKLLQDGYSVTTTVRSDPKDTTHLKKLQGAAERLQIFDEDLNTPSSFLPAIEGCVGICADSETVKRVVYISSSTTVMMNGKNKKEVDESDWTDLELLGSLNISPYVVSKTMTEKAALKFAEERGLDLVSVLPALIVGPFLGPNLPIAFQTILGLIRGDKEQMEVPKMSPVVHIDDVVAAHTLITKAKGRYICSTENPTLFEIASLISAKYPECPMPELDPTEEKSVHFSSEKLLSLGFKFKHCVQEMLEEMEMEKGKVCVTGGAGYLASNLIMKLLQDGYSVTTTVRSDPEFEEDTTHLKKLHGAAERLQIFDADLNTPSSFRPAIEGCVGVFHVAHPINFSPECFDSVIKTSVDGLLGLLQICADSETVKRVMYTSSVSTVMMNGKNKKEVDESDWTDLELLRSLDIQGSTYVVSKTMTEKAALKFAEERGLDLVSVLPALIVGPFLGPNLPIAFHTILALIRGDKEQMEVLKMSNVVHVDDVAAAHVYLFERPEAKGRYICSTENPTLFELATLLSGKYPEYPMPELDPNEEKPVQFSSEKLLSLGFKFKHSVQEMFDDAISCCKEKGFL
ncbi:hypothetical protein H6P81_016742 [Aristolochia fimbriata]|uniref:NAD-dependent epimerase/dehydratase domain-containing protein n=1 Tax=Aristolochia fimbriata TaxID=158543 RepID=A0AAV7E970_ARIFI|nr:hypothetical protein H6P81_016742 [Aristolochia fimbriata]